MNRTIQIVIDRRSFFIDEEAHLLLKNYMKSLEQYYSKIEYGKEVLEDIEARISELLSQRVNSELFVVTKSLVEDIVKTIGMPDDITNDSEGNSSQEFDGDALKHPVKKRLFRDLEDKKLGGVCSGLAYYLNMDTSLIRIAAILLIFLSIGYGLLVYIVLWILVPPALTTAQILEMRGENVTIKNIQNYIEEEFEKLRQRFSNRAKR